MHTEQNLVHLQKEWEDVKLSEIFSFKECNSLKEALKFIVSWDDFAEDLVLKEFVETIKTTKKTRVREII